MINRRSFLATAASAAGATRLRADGRKILLPSDTPDEFGLRIMWYNPAPPIDKRSYKLEVGGLVKKPQQIELARLKRYDYVEQTSRMKCVQCWSSRLTWGGFRFSELLDDVKPLVQAKAVRFDCHDGWYEYMSLEEMANPRVLMTMTMKGEPLTDQHGAPLRLIAPSKYGYKSCKLITKITFVEKGEGSMACDLGPYYSPDGAILPGYDHPIDLGRGVRRKISGGEITEY